MHDLLFYKPQYFIAEYELASYLRDIIIGGCDQIVPHLEGLKFKQPLGVINACRYPLSILTGAAGTGKTTTLNAAINSFQKAGMRGVIVSQSGKAAKRADEVVNKNRTKKVACSTIHRLLEFNPMSGGFTYNRHNKFSSLDYLVIDEYPTCDIRIANNLLSAIEPRRTRIILSGDPYQLPSVDVGNLGRDLLSIPRIPVIELTDILRQGVDSGIVFNANRILRGQSFCKQNPMTGEVFTDCFFTSRKTEQETLKTIQDWLDASKQNSIPSKRGWNPVNDVQLLSPGKRSIIGVKNLNDQLRPFLNKHERSLLGYYIGDKVINHTNNYRKGIVNGDVGIVKDVKLSTDKGVGHSLLIDFGYEELTEIDSESIDNISLAYALTVHKTQGSEYRSVILALHQCHAILMTRNMLYTGMTRPRELLCIIGDERSLSLAIKNDSPSKRKSRLKSILNSMLN